MQNIGQYVQSENCKACCYPENNENEWFSQGQNSNKVKVKGNIRLTINNCTRTTDDVGVTRKNPARKNPENFHLKLVRIDLKFDNGLEFHKPSHTPVKKESQKSC